MPHRQPNHPYRPFILWCAWFLSVWAGIVIIGQYGPEVAANWPMAVAMALGSYLGGSTPVGGAAVGYPILVLLFEEPAETGRLFSLMIQSVGLTSAAVFILCSRRPVLWRLLVVSTVAGSLTLPVTLLAITPRLPDTAITMVFATMWASFGLFTLFKLSVLLQPHRPAAPTAPSTVSELWIGIVAGVLGGLISGLTGVGMNMVLFVILLLVCRAEVRTAISTSVMAMAVLSLVGAGTAVASGPIPDRVFYAWLAAAPVVLFGAPLGAFAVMVLPRKPTLLIVAGLCLLQLFWAVLKVGPSPSVLLGISAGLVGSGAAFWIMLRLGARAAQSPA